MLKMSRKSATFCVRWHFGWIGGIYFNDFTLAKPFRYVKFLTSLKTGRKLYIPPNLIITYLLRLQINNFPFYGPFPIANYLLIQ